MKTSDIVKAGIIVAAIAGFFYFTNKASDEGSEQISDMTSQASLEETEKQIEEQFRTEVPEGAERAELKGDVEGRALATRQIEDGTTDISVLVDLPDPASGEFYQAWVMNGDEDNNDFERISLGRLRIAKGGYITDFTSERDLSDFNYVVVTQESTLDSEPEQTVLEGSFK